MSSAAIVAGGVRITATAATTGPTGVEMEALTAAAVAALTVYDMTKALDKAIVIRDIQLESKSGGKSGRFYEGRITAELAVLPGRIARLGRSPHCHPRRFHSRLEMARPRPAPHRAEVVKWQTHQP